MKRLSILFLSVMALGLSVSSCSNDDDNEGTIEGTWALTEAGGNLGGQEFLVPVENEGGCETQVFVFAADATFTETASEFNGESCDSYEDSGKWSKDGNKLNLTYGSNTEADVYVISELSGSTLKLTQTYSELGTTITSILVYKKR